VSIQVSDFLGIPVTNRTSLYLTRHTQQPHVTYSFIPSRHSADIHVVVVVVVYVGNTVSSHCWPRIYLMAPHTHTISDIFQGVHYFAIHTNGNYHKQGILNPPLLQGWQPYFTLEVAVLVSRNAILTQLDCACADTV
jgi:hypothetical protein